MNFHVLSRFRAILKYLLVLAETRKAAESDTKGQLLLEVNSSPGLEGIETATGKDIAEMLISSIEKKLR